MIAIVSNMLSLPATHFVKQPSERPKLCNMGAMLCRSIARLALSTIAVLLFAAIPVEADQTGAQNEHPVADTAKFLGGAATAFALHEAGHLLFDVAFDAQPYVKAVHFGPVPFFAVTHPRELSPRRELVVSSAGFWTQEATSEWILTRRPDVRHDHAPYAKGVLAFNVLTSVGYGIVAFAKAGPIERDTRGMASSIRVDERAIGALIIAPAALDAYRYFKPRSRWAAWTSRGVKIGSVLLVLR
jgi:hypothetical protein